MSLVSRARDAAVEAVLAAAVAGVVEGIYLGAPLAAAAAFLGLLPVALGLRALIAAVRRVALVKRWSSDVAAGGVERTIAIWRVVLVAVLVVGFAVLAFAAFAWAHDRFRFNDAGAIGVLYVGGVIVLAVTAFVAGGALDRIVSRRLPARMFDGTRIRIVAVLGAIAFILVPRLLIAWAAPAVTISYVALASVLVVALLAIRVDRFAARPRVRIGLWSAAGVCVVGGVVGTWLLARAPGTRLAIVERGVASDPVARALRAFADGDGDGFAPLSAGGSDCDDATPTRSPRARDIPGNGIDENCTGADATPAAFGLRTQSRPVPPALKKPNVVVISVDALRADRLGSYGYARKISPALDALAARGVRFDWAFTSCPSTRCAIPSLLTGRFASTLPEGPDRDTIPSLASTLRAAGWQTAAITCCERFAIPRWEQAAFQTLDATADTVRMQRAGQSNADVVVDKTLAWLNTIDPARPYFVWLHLYEPHFPYDAPSGPDLGDSDSDRYDAEIAFADAQIGRLVAALDVDTIVVITSDHGEELGEHGIRFHARSLYNQVIRVPLIIRAPGVAARNVETPVSIVDVMPTLLELAGVEGPVGMNGRSLVPALRGGQAPPRPILVELERDHQIKRDMAAVISPPWKVIWDREANAWALYRLDDRADTTDRSDDAALPELQRVLMETLDRETGVLLR